jgi:hypothetical protein
MADDAKELRSSSIVRSPAAPPTDDTIASLGMHPVARIRCIRTDKYKPEKYMRLADAYPKCRTSNHTRILGIVTAGIPRPPKKSCRSVIAVRMICVNSHMREPGLIILRQLDLQYLKGPHLRHCSEEVLKTRKSNYLSRRCNSNKLLFLCPVLYR